jgi:hypothetical protein
LGTILQAIEDAEQALAASRATEWEAFRKIIEVINMHNDMEWMKKYYTDEQLEELRERGANGVAERGQQQWAELIREVEEAVSSGEDPSSEKSQQLAARWSSLIEAFTGGNPAIMESLKRLYADQANWPSTFQKPYGDDAASFIAKANAARKQS